MILDMFDCSTCISPRFGDVGLMQQQLVSKNKALDADDADDADDASAGCHWISFLSFQVTLWMPSEFREVHPSDFESSSLAESSKAPTDIIEDICNHCRVSFLRYFFDYICMTCIIMHI